MSGPDASPTRALARFAARLTAAEIPAGVVDHAFLCMLDTAACGLAGARQSWTLPVTRFATRWRSAGRSRVWGRGATAAPPEAALANGIAVHALEMDDLHPRSILHPGSVVVPAAFALADEVGASAADILAAVVTGYEVGARVGMSVGAAHLLQGWHPTGTHGAIASAAAAGRVLALDEDRMIHALGIAGSQSSGLMAAQYGAMVKRFHAGHAAQSGVTAALLAADGYTGVADLFEASYGGYCSTFSPSCDLDALTAGLGQEWATADVVFKFYAANGSCHPAIDLILELRREGLSAEDIESIDAYVSTATFEHVGWPYRTPSVTAAQMNLGYVLAAALLDGDVFIDQFAPDRLGDVGLLQLAERVRPHVDADTDRRGDAARHATRLEVRTREGRVRTVRAERARRPVGAAALRDAVEQKARRLGASAGFDGGALVATMRQWHEEPANEEAIGCLRMALNLGIPCAQG